MKTLVQKFGGTSLATATSREQVVKHIQRAREAGYRTVVVVSAIGRAGDPYATDTLLSVLHEVGGSLCAREQDLLLSCGEIVAAVVMAHNLRKHGIPAVALTGRQAGIITDNCFGNASVLAVRADLIKELLDKDQVPVVTGFQGVTVDGDVTTLGRGGSDTTAAVLGAALSAELIEIYTDVDGIKTADPRLVPEAMTLDRITYSEAVELAHLGAKVVHPRAVQVAMASRIPLRIRGTHSDSPGTLVSSSLTSQPEDVLAPDRHVTGITCVSGQVYVEVRGSAQETDTLSLTVFERMGKAGISLDMIHVSQGRIAFTVAAPTADEAERVLASLGFEYRLERGYAKVSAVGAGMHGVPGVVSRVFKALTEAGVAVYETSDSHANISCLVRETDAQRAVSALHREFLAQALEETADEERIVR